METDAEAEQEVQDMMPDQEPEQGEQPPESGNGFPEAPPEQA